MVNKKIPAIPSVAAILTLPVAYTEGVLDVFNRYLIPLFFLIVFMLLLNAVIGHYSRRYNAHTYLGEIGVSVSTASILLILLNIYKIYMLPQQIFAVLIYAIFVLLLGITTSNVVHFIIKYKNYSPKKPSPLLPPPPAAPGIVETKTGKPSIEEIKKTVLYSSLDDMEEDMIVADVEPIRGKGEDIIIADVEKINRPEKHAAIELKKEIEAVKPIEYHPETIRELEVDEMEELQRKRELQTLIEAAPASKKEGMRKTADLLDVLGRENIQKARPKAAALRKGDLKPELEEIKRAIKEIQDSMEGMQGEMNNTIATKLLGRELKDWETLTDPRIQELIFDNMLEKKAVAANRKPVKKKAVKKKTAKKKTSAKKKTVKKK